MLVNLKINNTATICRVRKIFRNPVENMNIKSIHDVTDVKGKKYFFKNGFEKFQNEFSCSETPWQKKHFQKIPKRLEKKNRFQILKNDFFKIQNDFYSISSRFHQNFSKFSNVSKRFFSFSSRFQYKNETFFCFHQNIVFKI